MADNLNQVFSQFFSQRTKPLGLRFNGLFRAVVVETNDPLRMHRVRFKIPELHDWDIKPEECQWAVPSPDLGTKRAGRWSYPCIGDYIWVQFEKNHAYAPVYTGFSDPTRRKFYTLPSIFGKTPRPVTERSDLVDSSPDDYNVDYLPKDERPMSHGWQDRYGNLDMHSAVGFFPTEHDVAPPPPDSDRLAQSSFEQSTQKPVPNDPDSKFMLRMTKYGNFTLHSDIGYIWRKDEEGEDGEFKGQFEDTPTGRDPNQGKGDESFEIKRWKYLQRLVHEDSPKEKDQRRTLNQTRYGHKIEMRDVGWNKTREGEFEDEPRTIGSGDDERWVKIRTKGGHLIEAIDIGSDPEEDEFVKRQLIDEVDKKDELFDKEDKFEKEKTEWNQYGERDARMLRFITRSGLKLVLDDRTSHDKAAEAPERLNKELGIGVLIKGRATPGTEADDYGEKSGDPKGFFWQFDERPDRNSTTWGTPLGQVVEMDDNQEYMVACSRLPNLPTAWKYLEDNEFLEDSAFNQNPARSSHHLVIDHGSEAIRLKSRAGRGVPSVTKRLGDGASGEHAGIEIHDAPADDPWVEMVDHDRRGIWFSRKNQVGIWHSKQGSKLYVWLDDNNGKIVVHNGETGGKVQIFSQGDIEVIGRKVTFSCDEFGVNAKNRATVKVGGASYNFGSSNLGTNVDIRARNVRAFFPTAEKPCQVCGRGTGIPEPQNSSVAKVRKESVPTSEPNNRL